MRARSQDAVTGPVCFWSTDVFLLNDPWRNDLHRITEGHARLAENPEGERKGHGREAWGAAGA